MISNLLSNSVKYTPPEKKILLSARHEGREAVLRVADEGVVYRETLCPTSSTASIEPRAPGRARPRGWASP